MKTDEQTRSLVEAALTRMGLEMQKYAKAKAAVSEHYSEAEFSGLDAELHKLELIRAGAGADMREALEAAEEVFRGLGPDAKVASHMAESLRWDGKHAAFIDAHVLAKIGHAWCSMAKDGSFFDFMTAPEAEPSEDVDA